MKTSCSLLMVLFALPAVAGKTEAVLTGPVSTVQSLDEVLVQGDRTLSAARKALIEAENRFYSRWNEINGDPQFEIRCHDETAHDHPTRITQRVCQPAFIERLDEQAAELTMSQLQGGVTGGATGSMLVNLPSSGPQQMLLREQMKKRTLQMIDKDPQLKRALLERARLEQHYEDLRKAKFKDHWIVWD